MCCAQDVFKKAWLACYNYTKYVFKLFYVGKNGRQLFRFYLFDIFKSLFSSFFMFILISMLYILIALFSITLLYYDKIQLINISNLIFELKDEYKINLSIAILTLLSVHFGFWRNRQQMKEQHIIQYKLNSAQEINELFIKTSDNLIRLKANIYIIDNFMQQLAGANMGKINLRINNNEKLFEEYYKMFIDLCNHEIIFKKKQGKFMSLMSEIGLNFYIFEIYVRYYEILSKLKEISLPFNRDELLDFFCNKYDRTQFKRLLQNVDALHGSIQITYDVIASRLQKDIIKGKLCNLLTICRSEDMSKVIIDFANYMKSRKNYHTKRFNETEQELPWKNFINYETGALEKEEHTG